MAKIGLIRCEKNETRCPLTGCIQSLQKRAQGFAGHAHTELVGLFTCHCPGDGVVAAAKILKSKGADTIHFCTCAFAGKQGDQWGLGQGFCDHLEALAHRVRQEADVLCILGTAHLPVGYTPQKMEKIPTETKGDGR